MGDLAPRPRGGWQVGTHVTGRRAPSPWTPEHPDPAPDVYAVERPTPGRFIVKHYRTSQRGAPVCCVVDVTQHLGETDIETLQRAYPPFALCSRR